MTEESDVSEKVEKDIEKTEGELNKISSSLEEIKKRLEEERRTGVSAGPPIHSTFPGREEIKSYAPGATVRTPSREGFGGIPPTEGPPAPPEGRREEREGPKWKKLRFKVVEKDTSDNSKQLLGRGNPPIEGAKVTVSTPFIGQAGFTNYGYTETSGIVEISVPKISVPYTAKAEKEFYKTSRERSITVDESDPQDFTNNPIEIEPEPLASLKAEKKKEEEEKKLKEEEKEYREKKKGWLKGAPVLDKGWWASPNTIFRLILAFFITLAVNFWLYQPSISATGIERNVIMVWLLPFLLFFLLFFSLPKKLEDLSDWGPLILGAVAGIGTWVGFQFFVDMELAPFIKFGIPLIVYFVVWSFARKSVKEKKGIWPTLAGLAGILALIGIGVFLFTLIQSGGLTNMETYLKPLNILHLVGVPQDTIDNMKEGIRNVLSFLQFKVVEPVKPEAKKIGGFEAIQLKFGSKYNNYLLPTLFANMDYSLPVSIINPNSLTSPIPADKLTIRNFYITDVFLNNRSDNRIMCGNIIECTIESGCEITPESEKTLTLDFKNGENCDDVVKKYRLSVIEPLYPVKISEDIESVIAECRNKCGGTPEEKANCLKGCEDKQQACNSWCNNLQWNKLTPKPSSLSGDTCKCEFKRVQNIMDELCFMSNDKATIELKSNYKFSVEGKGELIIVQKETDKKLAPKPSITSSAGPLTITTYFVPDIVVLDKEVKTAKMFVQISNDGDGTATIKLPKGNLEPKYDAGILKITSCVPEAKEIFVGKEDSTIVCDVTAPSSISGNYLTSPVIVNIDYTYSQEHSTTLNVKKAYIPEGVDDNRAKELYGQISPLPYYCHRDISGVDTAIDIYK